MEEFMMENEDFDEYGEDEFEEYEDDDNNKEKSFEESLNELEIIVRRLENGDVPLDDAIDEFHKAMILVKSCDSKLNNAKESIAQIVRENGDIINFNIDD